MRIYWNVQGKCANAMLEGSATDRAMCAVAVLVAAAGLAPGCAEKHVQVVNHQTNWGMVFSHHISTHSFEPIQNRYRIVVPQPTKGLFPTNLGVTRVAVEILDEIIGLERPVLLTDPRNEFLQWNSALDNLFAISEVFPISQFDLGGERAEPEQILAAFRALHARLCLIYAMNELSEVESEIIATLYNTTTGKPIAYFHARAVSVDPPAGRKDETSKNLWKTDSKALVRAKFESYVHACIQELILQDLPAEVESPEGWKPVEPVHPAAWPPRNRRSRW